MSLSADRQQLGPSYSRIEAWGWSNEDVPSDWRIAPYGFVAEFDKVAYARVDQYYYTNYDRNYFPTWQNYSRQLFNHSREVALDRETGAVFIFDTSVPWSTLNETLLWAFGASVAHFGSLQEPDQWSRWTGRRLLELRLQKISSVLVDYGWSEWYDLSQRLLEVSRCDVR